MEERKVIEFSLARIYPNPDQPRKDFDEEKLEELAASIRQYGVLQPIVVTERGDMHMIVAGERRYRAAKLAGRETIPAIAIVADNALVEELALLENIKREDLNPIEEGAAYARLLERMSPEELARRLGYKKVGPILDRVLLMNLKPEYQEMAASGAISPTVAYELARLPRYLQDAVHAKLAHGGLKTAAAVTALVARLVEQERQGVMFTLEQPTSYERDSCEMFGKLISQTEALATALTKDNRLAHLSKAVQVIDVTPERVAFVIETLQKGHRALLAGHSVRELAAAVA